MSISCSAIDAVNSGNWFPLFKELTLNVTIWTVFLHLSNFYQEHSHISYTQSTDCFIKISFILWRSSENQNESNVDESWNVSTNVVKFILIVFLFQDSVSLEQKHTLQIGKVTSNWLRQSKTSMSCKRFNNNSSWSNIYIFFSSRVCLHLIWSISQWTTGINHQYSIL